MDTLENSVGVVTQPFEKNSYSWGSLMKQQVYGFIFIFLLPKKVYDKKLIKRKTLRKLTKSFQN